MNEPDDLDSIQDSLTTQLDFFTKKRESLFAEIQDTYDATSQVAPGSVSSFLARASELNRLKDKFELCQENIMKLNLQSVPAKRVDVNQTTKAFNELYYKIRKIEIEVGAHVGTTRLAPPAVTQGTEPLDEIKLPQIEVPVFDGNLENFHHFWQIFNTVVHKRKTSNVVKMTYLLRSLRGSPLKMVEHFKGEDYLDAYQLIYDRYGNTRHLAAFYADKILSFSPLSSSSAKDLQSFLDVFHTTVTAYNNLRIDNHHDFIMFQCAFRVLPTQLRTLFERSLADRHSLPTFDTLIEFVQNQCLIDELTKRSLGSTPKPSSNSKSGKNPQTLIVNTADSLGENESPSPPPRTPSTKCTFCSSPSHKIYRCEKYGELSLEAKYDWLKENRRCFQCLGSHNRDKCGSKGECEVCKSKKHHSSLHSDKRGQSASEGSSKIPPVVANMTAESLCTNSSMSPPDPSPGTSSSTAALSKSVVATSTIVQNNRTVLLGTVQCLIRSKWGKMEPLRLVVDGASQVNLISAQCTQRLGLPIVKKDTHIDGALSQSLGTSKGVVSCTLAPRNTPTRLLTAEAVVVNKVCSDLPTSSLPIEIFERFSHLQLADRSFIERGEIDFLLGASLYAQIFENNCSIIHGEPSAFETIFGWVIIGNVQTPPSVSHSPVSMLTTTSDVDLDRSLQAFWRSEEVLPRTHVDPMHQLAEDHFVSTHTRRSDGSYEVSLPFKPHVEPHFAASEAIAHRRWLNQEKKFQKDPRLRVAYHNFLKEYKDLGHMSLAEEKGEYYVPHFGILRNSPTSPLRVVFDASCKDANGKSLNDCLLVGPPLQKDIRDIVTLFRLKPIALISDIKMMYRYIWINPSDAKYQHILWRDDADTPILDFELKTLVYGQASSPFLAQRVLQALVQDEGVRFPLASNAIMECCFMDDLCTSVESESEALQLKEELVNLMKRGGFELRKWASNSQSVLSDIPQEHLLPSLSLQASESTSLHVLGLQWEPREDVFTFNVSHLGDAHSKREVSSRIASLFDPLGWLSPVIFKAKLFLRELWERSLDWDTKLPPDVHSRWIEFSAQFTDLVKIKIPRLLVESELTKFQLIGFCDASSLGYAAVLYLRCYSEDESRVSVTLITSKSKVAPLKTLTIPRLELNAALLLARVVSSVQPLAQKLNLTDVKLFSDSSVALGWIHTPPHLLQVYVANRVVSILEHTELPPWHHISTSLNIADIASRGTLPSEIVDHPSWWAGPDFLYQPETSWPLDQIPLRHDLPEMKTKLAMPVVNQAPDPKPEPLVISIINRYSSLFRLKRVVAWVLRFVHNCRQRDKQQRRKGVLQPYELQESIVLCIKATQGHHFSAELGAINKGKPLPIHLRRLSPFLLNGILRVGGRLTHSSLADNAKHPPLLPKEARLSALIAVAYHRRLLHAGPQATMAAICQEFWILSLRGLLRKCIFKCGICHRYNSKEKHPVMADLPASRVTPCAPFSRTAIDYAGPVVIKQSLRRNAPLVKAWICVFVCMVTKGVHLELVSSLSSECFLGALNRFVGRRGLCKDIYCDNGTNFHGACSEEKAIYQLLKNSHPEIADALAERHITYHFNPPESPWMGGIFEAAVKSAKRHMRHISTRNLTYEELNTVLIRVESVLNSRPLCPVGDSPDSVYLSPAHFLIGRSLLTPIEHDVSNEPHLSRWQSVQQAAQIFWKRWSTNYLQTLMERKKWTDPRPPLKEGDVVIVLRQNAKPLDWPLGRVLKLHPGEDGVARAATVRTSSGVFVRPVARLSPFPTLDAEED